jgi:hypothetical protein
MSLIKRQYFEEINKQDEREDEEYFYNQYKLKPKNGNEKERQSIESNKAGQKGQLR